MTNKIGGGGGLSSKDKNLVPRGEGEGGIVDRQICLKLKLPGVLQFN